MSRRTALIAFLLSLFTYSLLMAVIWDSEGRWAMMIFGAVIVLTWLIRLVRAVRSERARG